MHNAWSYNVTLIFVRSSLFVDCIQMDNMAKVSIQINIFILDYLTLEMFNTFSAVLGEGGHANKLMTLSFEHGNRIFIRNKYICF